AVVGAGAVVAGDIPPYAIAVGVPARVIRYRFDPDTVERLCATKWWDLELDGLAEVERDFWDVEGFVGRR
ncbi:MAG: antibiotic acetyltransferase, partial [Coriobacteriia bacterium]